MMTEVTIEGTRFLLNGEPTYAGKTYRGRSIEGRLFNARLIQAIFDDENPETRPQWAYPDTGIWDPDRNTAEFCAALPEYKRHGLLAFTVGLQGGGSIYAPEVYDHFVNSAFGPDGTFKPAYFDRLLKVLQAADALGMVVIVNYFYFKQVERIPDEGVVKDITARVTEWLLRTGYRNILIDTANEAGRLYPAPLFQEDRVHELIEVVQGVSVDGRRVPVGVSTLGGEHICEGRWRELEDFHMPHGNGCKPEQLREKLQRLKATPEYQAKPRPILINEDSPHLDNFEAALAEDCSWGFYQQGYGSEYGESRADWKTKGRERRFEDLSGFQTVPVNWGINTPSKRAFFDRLAEVTSGDH
ncbi:MAG: hypothetical protein ACFB21_03675 [Opitutales bacterium]